MIVKLGEIPQNKCTCYLLPTIGLKANELLRIYPDYNSNGKAISVLEYFGFKNVYLEDINDIENHPNALVMLFNPDIDGLSKWHIFQAYYSQRYRNYIKTQDLDFGVISVTFDISNPSWYNFKEIIKRSKYSELDKKYSKLVFTYYDEKNGSSSMKQDLIITKSSSYRNKLSQELNEEITPDMELDSKINLEEEVLDYPKLKEKYGINI